MTRTNDEKPDISHGEDGLTDMQRVFVQEYVIDMNKTQAAIRAGYSKASACHIGWELLEKPTVQAAVDKILAIDAKQRKRLGERALREWISLGFSNAQDFADIVDPLQLKDMDRDKTAAIQELKTSTYHMKDGEKETSVNVKLYNKEKALENLAKIAGLLIDRSEVAVSVDDDSPWELRDPTKD